MLRAWTLQSPVGAVSPCSQGGGHCNQSVYPTDGITDDPPWVCLETLASICSQTLAWVSYGVLARVGREMLARVSSAPALGCQLSE